MQKCSSKKRHPVGPNWELCHKIAQGSFGKVYYGVHSVTNTPVAVKTEPLEVRHPQLPGEASIYMALRNVVGVPKLLWHGHVDKKFDAIVLQLLGPDLDQLLTYCEKFSLRTVLLIADQLLDRLESLHKLGYVYRDIKPQNFAIGYGADGMSTLYILDFGLAKKLPKPGEKIKKSSGLVGTARYASIGAHRGDHSTCANDLESLGYMMMYWLRGSLPWSGLKAKSSVEKYEKIMAKKLEVPLKQLCKGHPSEMIDFITYCRAASGAGSSEKGKNSGGGGKTDGGNKLDYKYLHGLIAQMATKANKKTRTIDGDKVGNDTFDWFVPQGSETFWPDPALPEMGSGHEKSCHPLENPGETKASTGPIRSLGSLLSRSNSKSSKYAISGGLDDDDERGTRKTSGSHLKKTSRCTLL
jgi:serine/threonine protein kinase